MEDDKMIMELLLINNSVETVYRESVECEKNPFVRIYYRNLFFQCVNEIGIKIFYSQNY